MASAFEAFDESFDQLQTTNESSGKQASAR
jgi:hypothetical protein